MAAPAPTLQSLQAREAKDNAALMKLQAEYEEERAAANQLMSAQGAATTPASQPPKAAAPKPKLLQWSSGAPQPLSHWGGGTAPCVVL